MTRRKSKRTKSKAAKFDIYEAVTAKLIERIESTDPLSWIKCWNVSGMIGGRPANIKSGKEYRGTNIIWLQMQGHSDHRWGTYRQWAAAKCQIRKGEKGTPIVFWKKTTKTTENDAGDKETRSYFLQRYYYVFNAEQVAGVESIKTEDLEGAPDEPVANDPHDLAAAYLDREEIKVRYGGDRACYNPAGDYIRMPLKGDFSSPSAFDRTLFHEMAHSTGHTSRLAREGVTQPVNFGSHRYSKEELIAEFTAAFLCEMTGIADDLTFENSAAYLKGWASRLKNNKKWAVSAAQNAQKAVDYIIK